MMNIMKKSYLFLATAIIALASCSENTYLGDQEGAAQGNGAISFGSNLPTLTRAVGVDAAKDLGYTFAVYATKTTPDGNDEGTDPDVSNVFAHNAYSTSGNTPYWVWYKASTANTTASNSANWEYVGTGGDVITPAITEQTIKYWDYSATQYDFVAYKAKAVGEPAAAASISKLTTTGFTVSGSAAQLAALYVANKKTISSTNYGKEVEFTFRSSGAKVRLGIYETINGYDVKNVKFYYTDGTKKSSESNAYLAGSFNGSSSSASGTYNVTYNSDGLAVFANTASSTSVYFDFGTFASGSTAMGETSISPTWASGSSDYQGVLPNTESSKIANMVLEVDYQLSNSTTGETINVKGAKAVVPSNYMTWKPNYAYTYLFKISDNTNGKTGDPEDSTTPEGLFPITFDAVTIAATDGQEVGTITTVSTPAITTYQEGSVVDKEETSPAVSEHGITYAASGKPIYITVNTGGTLAELTTTNTKLYTVANGTTEADLILTTKTKTPSGLLSILSANEEKQGITFTSGKAAKFTPAANTTYAVQYQVSAAVSYTLEEYNTAKGTSLDETAFAALSDEEKTKTPAVYQYKIIVVGS
jgi:hypothetical protein